MSKNILIIKKDNNEIITELLLMSILLFTIAPFLLPISSALFYSFKFISIISFIAIFFRKKWSLPFNNNIDIIYFFFVIAIIVLVLLRPILNFNLNEYKGQLFDPYYFWGHALPLILLLGIQNISLSIIKKYIYIYGIIGVCLFILDFNTIFIDNTILSYKEYQEYLVTLSRPLTFLGANIIVLLIPHFFSRKVKILSVSCFLIVLFVQAYAARRGGVVLMCLIMVFSLYLLCDRKYGTITKYFILITILLFFIFLFYLVSDNFILLLSRMEEDTRSNVEYYLFKDFDHNYIDWLFGRGVGGTYRCPIGNPEQIPLHRDVIESGYLYYILKGGIIYLFCYISILSVAFIKGFFFSRNTFCKGLSLFILYNLLSLYPFGLPSFSFGSLFLWISVVWCMRNSCLKKDDDTIYKLINGTAIK